MLSLGVRAVVRSPGPYPALIRLLEVHMTLARHLLQTEAVLKDGEQLRPIVQQPEKTGSRESIPLQWAATSQDLGVSLPNGYE